MEDCYNPDHMILLVEPGKVRGVSDPRRTRCVSCLVEQLEHMSPETAVRALHDIMFLFQYSFGRTLQQRTGSEGAGFVVNSSQQYGQPAPSWGMLLRFTGVVRDLTTKVCRCVSSCHHVPLYNAGVSLLTLLFALVREPADTAALKLEDCQSLCMTSVDSPDEEVPGQYTFLLTELVACVCEATFGMLTEKVVGTVSDRPADLSLLLMTDLAERSPYFLCVLAEHYLPHLCLLTTTLGDASRLELGLYLLHQVFGACAKHPKQLERLAEALPCLLWGAQTLSFVDFLSWTMESFRREEPIVVNSLYLTRFVLGYQTTQAKLFPQAPGDKIGEGGVNGDESCQSAHSRPVMGSAVGLARVLVLMLLHPNRDVVATAAESLQRLVQMNPLLGNCPDLPDYIIESLRTASIDTALAVVRLLNVIPSGVVPLCPLLYVLFQLANISGSAFEEAVKGPYFMAAIEDYNANLNDVAQRIVRTVQGENSVSFHCYLLELLCLGRVCSKGHYGPSAVLFENMALISCTLLRLMGEFCSKAEGSTEMTDDSSASQLSSVNGLHMIPGEVLQTLICVVAFLLPHCRLLLIHVAAELLDEALRQFASRNSGALMDRCIVFDDTLGDALLALGLGVLRYATSRRGVLGVDDVLFEQQMKRLFRSDLLTMLIGIPFSSLDRRAQVLDEFLLLGHASAEDTGSDGHSTYIMAGGDGLSSPQMLLENSIYQQPNWAASLLWALAVAGSSQPIETARLDALFFEQLFFVTRFTEEARQAVALFGGVDASTLNEQIVSRERCIAAEATALKVSAARYKWTGALPHRDMIHLNSCVAAGGAFAAPEGVREFYLQMFRSADPSWLTALSTRIWGKVLLAVLVSNAVLGMKGARRPIQDVMEAHCFLFPNAKEEDECQSTLCSLVIDFAAECVVFLAPLFDVVRVINSSDDCSLGCHVISFLCRCVCTAAGDDVCASISFSTLLLERYVTSLLLNRDVPALLIGHIARLVLLVLSRLPAGVGGCCDHAVFSWAIRSTMRTGGEVYVWQVMFLLLRRSHGFELAVRHEAELRTLLGRKGPEVDVSPCVAAALATIRWMVEGEVVRHRVFRTPTMAQIPLEEWSRCSSENIPLRAFILCSAELRTRWCKPVQDNDMLSAVPLLVAWVSDIIVQEYGTVAAARLCYVFLKDFPHLSSLVEFLGIFLMALGEEPVGLRGNGAMPCRGVAERAWLFASFLSAWPPWAEASGLKTAVDGFLSELGNVSSQMSCDGAGRLRESPPSASDLLVNNFQPSADVCCAVQALVEACESQSKHCGPFPLSRAKDFFLQRPIDKGAVDIRKDVVFRAVSEDCELIIVC